MPRVLPGCVVLRQICPCVRLFPHAAGSVSLTTGTVPGCVASNGSVALSWAASEAGGSNASIPLPSSVTGRQSITLLLPARTLPAAQNVALTLTVRHLAPLNNAADHRPVFPVLLTAVAPTEVRGAARLTPPVCRCSAVQACAAAAASAAPGAACASASATFAVAASPLLAVLSGANATAGPGVPVNLDCSGSSDPDETGEKGSAGSLAYAWAATSGASTAGSAAGGSCLGADGQPLAFPDPGAPRQAVTLQAGSACTVSCTVSADGGGGGSPARRATASGFLIASPPAALGVYYPVVSIAPLVAGSSSGSTAAVNPSGKIVVKGSVTTQNPSPALEILWVQVSGPTSLNFSDQSVRVDFIHRSTHHPLMLGAAQQLASSTHVIFPDLLSPPRAQVSATRPSSPVLVLQPGALQPGAVYALRLTATDGAASAFAEVSLSTAAAPRGANGSETGSLMVSLSAGSGTRSTSAGDDAAPTATTRAAAVGPTAFTTVTLTAVGWDDDPATGPLQFQVRTAPLASSSSTSSGGDAGQQPQQWTVLSGFRPGATITASLPPGYPLPEGGPLSVQLCAPLSPVLNFSYPSFPVPVDRAAALLLTVCAPSNRQPNPVQARYEPLWGDLSTRHHDRDRPPPITACGRQ